LIRDNDIEFYINHLFPEHKLVSKKLIHKSSRSSIMLIELEDGNKLCKNYAMKIYRRHDPSRIPNEFHNMEIFKAKCKNKYICAPTPIIFDSKLKIIVTEYINGHTLKKILFSSMKNTNPNRIADLTAIALSEYHDIFKLKEDRPLDRNNFFNNLYANLSRCSLNIKVQSFLDFAPNNIMISPKDLENGRLYLIDFPGYIFGSGNSIYSPHRDLAYFKRTLDSITQYTLFRLIKKKRRMIGDFYKSFLNKYCEERGVCLNKYDLEIINSYLRGWRAQAASLPFNDILRTKDIKQIGAYLLSKQTLRQNGTDIFIREVDLSNDIK
jgi:hypothetical protein